MFFIFMLAVMLALAPVTYADAPFIGRYSEWTWGGVPYRACSGIHLHMSGFRAQTWIATATGSQISYLKIRAILYAANGGGLVEDTGYYNVNQLWNVYKIIGAAHNTPGTYHAKGYVKTFNGSSWLATNLYNTSDYTFPDDINYNYSYSTDIYSVGRHTEAYRSVSPELKYKINAVGMSYGSAMLAKSPEEEPDLIRVTTETIDEGYVYKTDLYADDFNGPIDQYDQYVKEHNGKDRYITIYMSDGNTIIGKFFIGGYSVR